jgi:cytochrome c biogenesis protein CcdA
MNPRLGATLGVLIVATAGVELAVLGWHVATHELVPRTFRMYVFGLGIPAVIMLTIGGWILRASVVSARRRQDRKQ